MASPRSFKRHHAVENAPMRIAEEVSGVNHLGRGVEGVVVNENRAEHGLFRVEVVRKRRRRCSEVSQGIGEKGGAPIIDRGASKKKSILNCVFFSANDAYLDLCGDLAMDLDRHGHLTKCFQWFRERDLSSVDLETFRRQRRGDVGRRHRSVERSFSPTRRGIATSVSSSRAREPLRLRLLLELARFGVLALPLDLTLVPLVDREREFARQQIVASVTLGDLDDVAAAPEVFDVFSEDDFHDRRS